MVKPRSRFDQQTAAVGSCFLLVASRRFFSLQDVEKELEKQIAMKAEAECALQLLETHVHQKQDTIIGLRAQVEEVKALNLEQYDKLQVSFCWKELSCVHVGK